MPGLCEAKQNAPCAAAQFEHGIAIRGRASDVEVHVGSLANNPCRVVVLGDETILVAVRSAAILTIRRRHHRCARNSQHITGWVFDFRRELWLDRISGSL